ncbi:hypothetical protein L195_g033625 [Trifolium pratense]|uniref:Uncharacterized protein n=1 Tax=Trifolium pratense TaxID=57577 RepID=A0A2K3LGK7_TRIPR|nr:hypothetical protein L195_g033625 [Trifolium pratense]
MARKLTSKVKVPPPQNTTVTDATMSVTLHAATVTSENTHHSVFNAVKKILQRQ